LFLFNIFLKCFFISIKKAVVVAVVIYYILDFQPLLLLAFYSIIGFCVGNQKNVFFGTVKYLCIIDTVVI